MADTFVLKRNDTWVPLRLVLEEALVDNPDPDNDAHWRGMDLSDVQVAHVWMRSSGAQVRTSPVILLDPDEPDPYDDEATDPVGRGHVAYLWQSPEQNPSGRADTAVAGTYKAEVELIYMDGRKTTVPRSGYFTVLINEDQGEVA
jgi:hypothetical protein